MHKKVRLQAARGQRTPRQQADADAASPRQREVVALTTRVGADCAACPFAVGGRPLHLVPPIGPKKPDGIVVLESPNHEEVRQQEPLVGPVGKEMNQALLDAGLARERLFIVNAIACRPNESRSTATMRKAVKCCAPLFWHYLEKFNPKTPTLVCGKWAGLAIDGRGKKVMHERGFPNLGWALERPRERDDDDEDGKRDEGGEESAPDFGD